MSKNITLVYFNHYLHEAGLHERFIEIIISEYYDAMVLVLKKSRFYKEFIIVARTNVRSFSVVYKGKITHYVKYPEVIEHIKDILTEFDIKQEKEKRLLTNYNYMRSE